MNAHEQEIERLAELLVNEEARRDVRMENWRHSEVVRLILDNYRPQVEWKDETPPADPWSDDLRRRYGGFRFITARLRFGGRLFKYQGMMSRDARHDQRELDHLKRHIRLKLGLAVVEWADGLPKEKEEKEEELST
jgi:hypothetical protein